MKWMKKNRTVLAVMALLLCRVSSPGETSPGEVFHDQSEVGNVAKPGAMEYNSASGTYLISGGGDNMWFTNDAFHFAWKRMSGDVRLAGDIHWSGTNGNADRKAGLR